MKTPGEEVYAYNRRHYGDIIHNARMRKGITQRALADTLHIQKNYISNWEAGRARPDLNIIPALCKALGISLAAFFGEPAISLTAAERHFLSDYRRLDPDNRRTLEKLARNMLAISENENRRRSIRVIKHDLRVSAGLGNPLDDTDLVETLDIDADAVPRRTDCIITVWGNSMEPTYHDGDNLFIQYTTQVEPGEVGIFVADGDGYVKEYQKDGLHSHNPDYATLHFNEYNDVRCVGRVLGILDDSKII